MDVKVNQNSQQLKKKIIIVMTEKANIKQSQFIKNFKYKPHFPYKIILLKLQQSQNRFLFRVKKKGQISKIKRQFYYYIQQRKKSYQRQKKSQHMYKIKKKNITIIKKLQTNQIQNFLVHKLVSLQIKYLINAGKFTPFFIIINKQQQQQQQFISSQYKIITTTQKIQQLNLKSSMYKMIVNNGNNDIK
eukprot:TRINITY_DN18088_c0_g1_i3.p2 TRINITY_DN18088_c0_g1~~TRINITY_DN18088_c0_g1_i3.p2  ORF type:complete len:189 (+),score=-15.13 TRINITY_DN18088_c0_g1_i3:550-1116(+)